MERISPPEPRRDEDALREPKVREAKLLGQRLMARDFDRQVAELQVRIAVLQVRIAVLNGYTALGIPVTEAVGVLVRTVNQFCVLIYQQIWV